MVLTRQTRRRKWWSKRTVQLSLAGVALLALAACSPEDGRTRGQLGADPGNTALPIELRGNRNRNNPSFQVPLNLQAPRDARGVAGWWVNRGAD
jgi:hypothetical protein